MRAKFRRFTGGVKNHFFLGGGKGEGVMVLGINPYKIRTGTIYF